MKLALIGRTQILYQTALALADTGHKIAAVVTAQASPEYTRDAEDFRLLARKLGSDYHLCGSRLSPEALASLRGCDAAVSVNWVGVLGGDVLGIFPHGVLNAHLGELPRYRGNACPNWAILNGEPHVALSIHCMVPGVLDGGRVLHQRRLPLGPETDIAQVYAWVETAAPTAFAAALKALGDDPTFRIYDADPDDPEGFRCYPRRPEDGFIQWSDPAERVLRLIRASGPPFAGAYTYADIGGRLEKITVLKARSVPGIFHDLAVPGQVLENRPEEGCTLVACGDAPIALLECRDSSGAVFAPASRWRSIRIRLGIRAEDMVWLMASGALEHPAGGGE